MVCVLQFNDLSRTFKSFKTLWTLEPDNGSTLFLKSHQGLLLSTSIRLHPNKKRPMQFIHSHKRSTAAAVFTLNEREAGRGDLESNSSCSATKYCNYRGNITGNAIKFKFDKFSNAARIVG